MHVCGACQEWGVPTEDVWEELSVVGDGVDEPGACNPNIGEVEAGGLGVQEQLLLHSKSEVSAELDSDFKPMENKDLEKGLRHCLRKASLSSFSGSDLIVINQRGLVGLASQSLVCTMQCSVPSLATPSLMLVCLRFSSLCL